MPDMGNYYDDEYIGSDVVTDVFHYAIHEGLGFSVSDYALTPSVNTGVYIVFKTPDTENYLHVLMDISGEDSCELRVLEGCTPAVGGADKTVHNKNRTAIDGRTASAVIAGNTNTIGAVQTGIASTGGTLIYDEFQSKGSGGRDASYELVLKKNTWYAFNALARVGNKNTGLNLTWFEIPHL